MVISHEHYDHCDLDALAGYRDLGVPIFAPSTVVERARARGFRAVHEMEVWQTAQVGAASVTATPGKHGVPEITFVLQGGGRAVYFGGDTLNIPSPAELPGRFGRFDLALLPTNGLRIRPLGGQPVVMSAEEAAALVAVVDALPGHTANLRSAVVQLASGVRREPGCLAFVPYEDAGRDGDSTCTRCTVRWPRSTSISRPSTCDSSLWSWPRTARPMRGGWCS